MTETVATPPAAPPIVIRHETTPPAPAPKEPETFSREYVQELRAENKGTRLKAADEQKKREEAEALAKTAADEANAKIAAAEAASKAATEQVTKDANARVIRAELKVAAQKAGMIDLDGLKLADLSKVTLEDDGVTVKGADELMTALKEAKPYLFGVPNKGTSNTTPPPPPGDTAPKKAKDMTEDERQAFLREHKKKFG